jgi:hypothetical protein
VVWGEEENWYNMWSSYRPLDFRTFGLAPVDRKALSGLHR